MKTVERAHTPKKMWQRIRLKRQYAAALAQIDEHLAYWPKFLVHKNKQRLTKITQYLIRMRKLQTKVRTKLVTMPARKEKMERRREEKAEVAAQLDKSIEKELLERLQSGTYGDIYNFPSMQYQKLLSQEGVEDNKEMDRDVEHDMDVQEEGYEEFIEDEEEEDEEEEEEEEIEWLSDGEVELGEASDGDMEDYYDEEYSGSEENDDEEVSDEYNAGPSDQDEDEEEPKSTKRKAGEFREPGSVSKSTLEEKRHRVGKEPRKKKRRGKIELEYEQEMEDTRQYR